MLAVSHSRFLDERMEKTIRGKIFETIYKTCRFLSSVFEGFSHYYKVTEAFDDAQKL